MQCTQFYTIMSYRLIKNSKIGYKKVLKMAFPEAESSYDTSIHGLRPSSLIFAFRNLFATVNASKVPLGRWNRVDNFGPNKAYTYDHSA